MEEGLSNGKRIVNKSVKKKEDPGQPLSKRQELNNHIVCMRGSVKQAKVQIINRLVHQIKKYKARKGSPKEQEKAQRKADRLLDEIQGLKKIKKDKVSLYALQDTQTLEAVLSDPQASTEERVLARLSHHNVVVGYVNKYRNANPNWDKQIPVLLEMTREKRKKKTDNPDSNTVTLQPVSSKQKSIPREEISEENDIESDLSSKEEIDSDEDTVGDADEIDKYELDENADCEVKKSLSKSADRKSKNTGDRQVSNANCDSSPRPKPPTAFMNKSEGTVKVKFLQDLAELETDIAVVVNAKQTDIHITQQPLTKRPKSAFFVGGIDEPKSPPERKSFPNFAPPHQNNQNGHSKPIYKKGKLVSKPVQPGRLNRKRQHTKECGPRLENRFGGNSEPIGAKKSRFDRDNFNESSQNQTHKSEVPSGEKLHPSWEAKKKQQQISLTGFKGKKIVFGDDD